MMRSSGLFFFVLVMAAGEARAGRDEALPHSPLAPQLLDSLGERFTAHHTDHFTIVYDTPYETLRPLTARLEGIYDAIERFCRTIEFPIRPLPSRLPIIVFARFEDFAAYAARAELSAGGVAGFYSPKTNVAAFVNVLDSPALRPLRAEIDRLSAMLDDPAGPPITGRPRDELTNRLSALRSQQGALVENFNRLVLQHEAAHQVFFNLGVHVRGARSPLWLVEGLACQFEVPQSDLEGKLKRINQMRLGDLREGLHVTPHVADVRWLWRQAIEKGAATPLDKLVRAEHLDGDQKQLAVKYAQGWGLVHFLHLQRPREFAGYLRTLAARTCDEPAGPDRELADFEDAFGKLDDAFIDRWVSYMIRLRYDPDSR